MRRYLVAGVNLLTLAVAIPAGAADVPVRQLYAPPVALFSWTGFYGGINGGGGWGTTGVSILPQNIPSLGLIGAASNTIELSGALVGGQAGFNYQIGGWVLGLEADAAWARLTGSNPCLLTSSIQGPLITTCLASGQVDAVGTFAGRVGIPLDRILFYLKSGAAWTSDRYSGLVTTSEFRWGWMVGMGVEYAFAGPWSAKVEYNYINLGTDRLVGTAINGVPIQARIREDAHTLKAGLNYRFGARF